MYIIIFKMLLCNIFLFLSLSHFFFSTSVQNISEHQRIALDLTGTNFMAGCALHVLLLKGPWRCLEVHRLLEEQWRIQSHPLCSRWELNGTNCIFQIVCRLFCREMLWEHYKADPGARGYNPHICSLALSGKCSTPSWELPSKVTKDSKPLKITLELDSA